MQQSRLIRIKILPKLKIRRYPAGSPHAIGEDAIDEIEDFEELNFISNMEIAK